MVKIVRIYSALQKVKNDDGTYDVVFPITRSSDVFVDLANRVSLDTVLGNLMANPDTDTYRQRMAQDMLQTLLMLARFNPALKVETMNNHAIHRVTSEQFYIYDKSVRSKQYALIKPVEYSPIAPTSIMFKIEDVLAGGVTRTDLDYQVQVANNGFDADIKWEDATVAFKAGEMYTFQNKTKELEKPWGIVYRITYVLPQTVVAAGGTYTISVVATHFS